MVDLGYDKATLLPAPTRRQLTAVEREFREMGVEMTFDPAYVRHVRAYHGGVPRLRAFVGESGREYAITRFLNFVDYHRDPILGQYNLLVSWTQISDRLDDHLVPFAELFAGDMACFDYEVPGRPSVVVWLHEASTEEVPGLDYVADDFDAFLRSLREPTG